MSEQLDLFGEPLTEHAHARTGDPWTSHAAAEHITRDRLRVTQQAVLECFERFGPMHDERLQMVYANARLIHGWPQQSVSGLRTRRSELVDPGGFLTDSGRTVRLASGRHSIVWEIA